MSVNQTKPLSLSAIFSFFKQSLNGEQQDYTSLSIRRAIFMLSIPMVLEMCMESVFALVDIFFVGKLGQDAISTVGLTESVLALVYALAIGLSMAATAMVARRIGEKNTVEATKAGAQAILLAVALSVILSVIGLLFAAEILALMGASGAIIEVGTAYMQIVFGGNIVVMLLFLINGIFRGRAMRLWRCTRFGLPMLLILCFARHSFTVGVSFLPLV